MDKIETLEFKIAKFLRAGVLVAGVFIFIGWMSEFSMTENPFNKFSTYQKVSFFNVAINGGWSVILSYAGLFILISLPIIRVMLTGFLFFRQKEKAMGTMAFVVLALLLISFVFGIEV